RVVRRRSMWGRRRSVAILGVRRALARWQGFAGLLTAIVPRLGLIDVVAVDLAAARALARLVIIGAPEPVEIGAALLNRRPGVVVRDGLEILTPGAANADEREGRERSIAASRYGGRFCACFRAASQPREMVILPAAQVPVRIQGGRDLA